MVRLALKDNGKNGDLQKNDGIYSTTWTPCAAKAYTLSVSNGSSYPVTVAGLTPCISVDPKSGLPGSQTTVTGTGFAAGEQVVIKFDKTQLAAVAADNSGAFATSVTIPNGAAAGKHTIQAKGAQSGIAVTARFRVT